ncbi:hypothetical protein FSP39_006840 [Pinctada imbricata]|uniref:START domain-containing protein n=1 Tax=Pinctada imbricata TaxID=66713 RepID=A0AA88Y563_PINIB|nr:hypothetical protein FSP39_006840 [Pinctada imbricata]
MPYCTSDTLTAFFGEQLLKYLRDYQAENIIVVYQVLRDVTKRCEWRPGTDGASNVGTERSGGGSKKGGSWMDTNVGQDVLVETVFDNSSAYVVQTVQRQCRRFWFREENGCCWVAESEVGKSDNSFYLIQPLEDVEQCLLTIVSHMSYPFSIEDNVQKLSSISLSVLDLFTQRKLRATPLIDIRLPSKHSHHLFRDPDLENLSSSEEETEKDVFSVKFSNLNPQERNVILQRSESILKLSKPSSKGRTNTLSDSNSRDLSGSDRSRPRAKTHPASTPNGNVLPEKNLPNGNTEKECSSQNVAEVESSKLEERDLKNAQNKQALNENAVKYTTLANQVAAELLALVVRVSNLDLRSPIQVQQETTGGWMFCGLENDIVIIKRHYHNINLCGSYIGKGIIQAPPQSVMDVIKNPRTRFTYDESLKEVQVLEEISDKIKIVYYRHEILHMFKRIEYDFTIIQSERGDGEKLVLSMETVDTGVPIPSGVNRVKMMTSGWIIEPITKENRLYSMVTYVMQMNFGLCSQTAAEKSLIEEMVSKQPLSIAHLRQYLRPTMAISRQMSTSSPNRTKKD